MDRPVRVLISKIGLDGHDRGAKLIVRNLRDAGMEVIYTGLWQTPASTVHAALQEDVDVLGVSLLSAAHMTVMPEVLRRRDESGISDLPVIIGGIMPEADKPKLYEMGVAGVYNPGTPMATIVDELKRLARERRAARGSNGGAADILTPTGLSRAITAVMDGEAESVAAPAGGDRRALCIGVTGAPGVGKSTFIGKLAAALRERGRKVAVIAVDPTSPLTGGALLGAPLRMMKGAPDAGLFVRSLSSAGEAGGIAPHTSEIVQLLAAAGFEVILVETVGAGQSDVAIRTVADEVLLLLMPGTGDAVQFSKAGVIEIATGFVVNKTDLPGSDLTVKDLRDSFDDDRPIWSVSSLRGEGLEPLCVWAEGRISNGEQRRTNGGEADGGENLE
ncbi:MAG: cobalamin-dependent protein [Phycisphaerae bacterium]